MNKNDLKAALTEKGITFTEEMTNKELTALLEAAPQAQPSADAPEATAPTAPTVSETPIVEVHEEPPVFREPEAPESEIDKAAAKEIADMEPAEAPKGIAEEEILAKMGFGLSRAQAIEVLQSQAAHDAALAAAEKNKGKA